MDLVKIGFQINVNGLKDANTEVDKLLNKVDNIGTKGKKASSEFDNSQKKIKDSTQQASKEVDKTTKALEKQKIIGDYLGKGLDKTTASIMANFQLLGAKTTDLDKMFTQLGKNKGAVELNKKVEKLQKEYNDISKASVKYLGGGILSQVGYQEQDLKNLNDQYRKAEQQVKQHGQNIYKQYDDISKSSTKRLGGGILDRIGFQESDLIELNNQYKAVENSAKAHLSETEKIRKQYDDISKSATKNLGGGVLDRVSTKNTELEEMRKMYKEDERIADARDKSQQATLEKEKLINAERQKAITLEQAKAKYVSQGFGKTDSTRLARLEVSGADVTTLNNYKSAIEATTRATQTLNPAVEKVTTSHSNFLAQVKGIAIYAALSAAIYGVMTAMTNLAASTVKMADEYTTIQNRMKLYVKDAGELGRVNAQLAQMSIENNVGLRETATLFSRLLPSMQKIGANTAAVTSVVDAFGKSMRIGGATAMEAASATIQFSQAMASGKLSGDEFRSISEASPRFLQAIADGSGIAAESLKKLSSEGFLTTAVVARALLKEYPKLIEENKKLGVTLEQGANAIKTGYLVAIGEFNEGAKITEALGESMVDLAQSMFTFAQTARQTGAEVKKWFEENADAIQTVVDAIKLLSAIVISRYVASLALAGIASVKLTYQTSALAAAQTASARSFVIGATAVTAFGRAAQTAFSFFGGVPGIALTIGGLAASYLLLRDNAAEATNKIVEQSEYVDLTTEAYKKLNAEQQNNAQASLIEDMGKINTELDSQAAAVNRVLLSYAQFKQMQGNPLNQETADVINQTVKGLISYDTAYRKLINLGVPKNVVEDFKEQKDVYNEAAKAGLKTEAAARAASLGIKLSGNEAQNASPAIRGLNDGVNDLGNAAISTAESFAAMVAGFRQGVADIKTTLKVMQSYDLSEGIAQQLIKESQNLASQDARIVDARSKIKKAKEEEIARLGAKPSQKQLDAISKRYAAMEKAVAGGQSRLAEQYMKLAAPDAQKLQAATDEKNKFTSDQNKSGKKASEKAENTAEQEQKRLQGIRASYDDQISAVSRLNKFKAEGMSYDVAKIAAEKDYYEAYTNVEKAFELAEARKTLARIDAKGALENETLLLTKLLLLQEKGVSYELSRTLAQAAFSDDQEGMLAAAQSMHNEIVAQQYSLADQVKQQTLLNHYLDKGLSIEEATVEASFKRLENIQKEAGMKGLSDQQKKLKEDTLENQKQLKIEQTKAQVSQSLTNAEKQRVAYVNAQAGGYVNLIKNMAIANKMASDPTLSPAQAKKLVEAEELTNYEKELAELKRQTYIATFNESDAVKTLVGNYSTMDSVQIGVLAKQQQLLEIAKELAEEAEKQRNNPIGDFSNVDFSVFGDFGNPFESALAGLNEFVDKSTESRNILASIEKDIADAKAQGLSTTELEMEKAILLRKETLDKKKAQDAAITSGLSLTKSLFKEESKGYKTISAMEKAYQASKIAFALWEKKDTIKTLAIKVAGYAKDMITFIGGVTSKIVAQQALNVAQAQGAVASAAQAPPPVGFASAAAMIALMAGLGIAISSSGSSGGEYVDTSNQGTGTVFGDSEAQSASIANSIDLLSENSDLMLPLTSAMLRSLRNIESSIGGVTNLILRGELGGDFSNLEFDARLTGILGTANDLFVKVTNGLESIGLTSFGLGTSIVSSIVGGLFGKTSQEVVASGLYAGDQKLSDILSNGINLRQYADVKTTKKSWFSSSSSTSTQYASVDEELQQQFTLIFGGFYDSILSATDSLGADMSAVKTNLENAVISIGKINLQGLNGEQIQEKLEAVFGAAADSLAKQGFDGLEDFQKVGEGYYETLIRVASSVEQAKYFTDRLNVSAIKYTDILNKQGDVATEIVRQSVLLVEGNKNIKGGFYDLVNTFDGTAEELTDFVLTLRDLQDQLFMTGKNADYLTSAMILGAGGLDKLSSGFDAYFEMLSPAEQAAELTRRLTKEFAVFGKELPSDVKAFRNLVSGIDISTEAGQKLYGQIIALAPEFNDLQDSIKSANSEVNALVQSLRDLAEQARAARGETEQPRNLAYVRNQFEQASVLAMQGDIASAEKLLTLGKDLMGLSKTYSVSGSEYARDLALIQRAATVAADIQEKGLGTSQTTNLTLPTTTPVTPTVNTTTSSTDARLDALSEKLEAGLFAIAKYTQDSASRLERWDDGGRMMVGIQPENGDTPIPVVVTP